MTKKELNKADKKMKIEIFVIDGTTHVMQTHKNISKLERVGILSTLLNTELNGFDVKKGLGT